MEIKGAVVYGGQAEGELLVLRRPLSFWGGADPVTGVVCDPRHPQYGQGISGRILIMERSIGSSSSSAIMLEQLRNGTAPAGVVVGATDAILVLGILVAQELGYPTVPLLQVSPADICRLMTSRAGRGTINESSLQLAV